MRTVALRITAFVFGWAIVSIVGFWLIKVVIGTDNYVEGILASVFLFLAFIVAGFFEYLVDKPETRWRGQVEEKNVGNERLS